jgi:hypothetical protein
MKPLALLQRVASWPLAPFVVGSLTLGLAPFVPEPHLFGKIRWVLGGAAGMEALDVGDLLLHGAAPAVLVVLLLARALVRRQPR